jgi:small nuclear ribonucleoprotein (snRNP)-like protein
MAGDTPTAGNGNQRSGSSSKAHPAHQQTLGSLLKHFEEMPLRVELKNGRIYAGVLDGADANMSLTLREAAETTGGRRRTRHKHPHPPPSTATTTTTTTSSSSSSSPPTTSTPPHETIPTFPLLQIRGSSIRYIHFPDEVDLAGVVQAGLERARQAVNKYQRGVRKGPSQQRSLPA